MEESKERRRKIIKNNVDFVSRAGEKLAHAIKTFDFSVTDLVVADFGSSTGGFVDCSLQNGATRVYAVETGYGILDWGLRNNPQVVVLERTNAMHAKLPEKVDLITSDTSWTKLEKVLPNIRKNLKPTGSAIVLVKPHYEADAKHLRKGKLPDEAIEAVLEEVKQKIQEQSWKIEKMVESPIIGKKGGNREFLFLLNPLPESNS